MANDSEQPSFTRETLSPEVFIVRPIRLPTHSEKWQQLHPPPKMIMLNTWAGALDDDIAFFVEYYRDCFPTAEFLVVKINPWSILFPSLANEAVMIAVDAIKNRCRPEDRRPYIFHDADMLVHAFSLGGMISLVRIIEALTATHDGTHESLPPHIKILDSCPVTLSIKSIVAFLSLFVPSAPRMLLHIIGYVLMFLVRVHALSDPFAEYGRELNTPGQSEIRRGYVYGELVDHATVDNHADDAQENGYTVIRKDAFDGTDHVAIVKTQDHYWWYIDDIWEGILYPGA
ncbi:Eukaryotic protein of unknown function (DUF829) domain containing protein [Naviculisporaceae sp. PSN 640]